MLSRLKNNIFTNGLPYTSQYVWSPKAWKNSEMANLTTMWLCEKHRTH